MELDKVTQTHCRVWVLVDDPNSFWWKEIDFHSGFLLSEIHNHKKTLRPTELQKVIEITKWPAKDHSVKTSWTLVSCKNHFAADWIFLIHDLWSFKQADLLKFIEDNNIKSLRCFAPFEPETSLKSRLEHCDLVSTQ